MFENLNINNTLNEERYQEIVSFYNSYDVLKRIYKFTYYLNIEDAINQQNPVEEPLGKVGVYYSCNKRIITILDDLTLSSQVIIDDDLNLNLNGKKITYNGSGYLFTLRGNCSINGMIEGSSIHYNINNTSSSAMFLIDKTNTNFTISGGYYIIAYHGINNNNNISMSGVLVNQGIENNSISVNDCLFDVVVDSRDSSGVLQTSNYLINSRILYSLSNTEITITNSTLNHFNNTKTIEIPEAYDANGRILYYPQYSDLSSLTAKMPKMYTVASRAGNICVKNSTLNVTGYFAYIYGAIMSQFGNGTITDSDINIDYGYGLSIDVVANNLYVENTKIYSDGVVLCVHYDTTNSALYHELGDGGSVGLSSSIYKNCDIRGVRSCIGALSGTDCSCEIYGGTYRSAGHGGFYFTHGDANYAQDAVFGGWDLSDSKYPGFKKPGGQQYNYTGKWGGYIGSGSDITVYMDNCKFDTCAKEIDGELCYTGPIVLRAGKDPNYPELFEHNNKLFISNSTFMHDKMLIRVGNVTNNASLIDEYKAHNLTMHVTIGTGCNFNKQNIIEGETGWKPNEGIDYTTFTYNPEFADAVCTLTNESYRR